MSEALDENIVNLKDKKSGVRGADPPGKVGEVLKSVQGVVSSWTKTLSDLMLPSDTAETSLRTRDRVIAGGLGALCFHSAIDLYKISYTATPSISGFNSSAAVLAVFIVLYWTFISCMIFGGYDRRADFPHVFKASFLFNVFIYTVGKLGFVINFGFL